MRLWAMRGLALAATGVAGYLAYVSLAAGDTVPGCGGLGCEEVLASQWAKWLGIPVSVPATCVYGAIFIATLLMGAKSPPRTARAARLALLPLSATAAGAALWFIALMGQMGEICTLCLAVHTCGLTIAAIVLSGMLPQTAPRPARGAVQRQAPPAIHPARAWRLTLAGLGPVVVLVAGQFILPGKTYRVESAEELPLEEPMELGLDEDLPPPAKPVSGGTSQSTKPPEAKEASPSPSPAEGKATRLPVPTQSPPEQKPREQKGPELKSSRLPLPPGASAEPKGGRLPLPPGAPTGTDTGRLPLPPDAGGEPKAGRLPLPTDAGGEPKAGHLPLPTDGSPDTPGSRLPLPPEASAGEGSSKLPLPEGAAANVEPTELPQPHELDGGPQAPSKSPAGSGPSAVKTSADTIPPKKDRVVVFLDGYLKAHVNRLPLVGDPEAEHVIVKLFDYTCKHCRKLHRQLEEARQRYGDQLAIVMLPVPLNSGCNEYIEYNHPDHKLACEYAKLAMAVWRLAPEKFPAFHKWLMGTDPLPTLSEARSRAEEYADAEALKREEKGEAVAKLLKQAILLFRRCKAGAIPKLILGDEVVRGEFRNSQELFRVLERHTGVQSRE